MTFKERFFLNFIKDSRWHYLTDGLLITLEVTFFAVLLGIVIGVISYTVLVLVTGKAKEKKLSPLMYVLSILFICKYIFL